MTAFPPGMKVEQALVGVEATAASKEQIVPAAIALLADRGYKATTFDAICRAAGLSSKRLITCRFAGKGERSNPITCAKNS